MSTSVHTASVSASGHPAEADDKGAGDSMVKSAGASEFVEFPKMARWSRDIIVTEKLDGTNAQVFIGDDGVTIQYGSRSRWITPSDDNYGFAAWAEAHREQLLTLGPGRHFGEWWGKGIQRNYSLPEKRFSLFNTSRWAEARPECCALVPVLYQGPMFPGVMERELRRLKEAGSFAAPGFMNPEGVVLFHVAANFGFKKTLEKDEAPKSMYQKATS